MIIVKRSLLFFIILFAALLKADPNSFSVTKPFDRPQSNRHQSALIAELKLQAVRQWVIKFVGAKKGAAYEPLIRSDTADRYVLKYQLQRLTTDKNQWELSGKLDSLGLKKWLRKTNARLGLDALAIKPLLTVTNNISQSAIEKSQAQSIESTLAPVFARYKAKLVYRPSDNLTTPPRSQESIQALAEKIHSMDFSSCLWLNFTPCESCPFGQAEIHFFAANPMQHAINRVFKLQSAVDPAAAERLMAAFLRENIVPTLETELDELIESGMLLSSAIRLRVVGIDSFSKFKKLEENLPHLDPITSVRLIAAESRSAQYAISSTLPAAEFYEQLDKFSVGDFRLKPEKRESDTITARY